MPYLIQQTLASLSDSDLEAVNLNAANPSAKDWLVLTHDPLGLDVKPAYTIAGISISFGEVGSDAAYIAVRISSTQTIIKKSVHVIGEAMIGTNFVIG